MNDINAALTEHGDAMEALVDAWALTDGAEQDDDTVHLVTAASVLLEQAKLRILAPVRLRVVGGGR